jgi:ATP-dependent protease ClpP protease subunit
MANHQNTQIPEAVIDAYRNRGKISLIGDIDATTVEKFINQLGDAKKVEGDIVLELTTYGGDAEMARRLVLGIEIVREQLKGKFYFLGKTTVYSAGVTIMSAFPCCDRYLTADAILLIHGRQLTKTVHVEGPIRSSRPYVAALLHQLDTGIELEDQGFRKLIDGSDLTLEEVLSNGAHNWYLSAKEALDRRLVAALV